MPSRYYSEPAAHGVGDLVPKLNATACSLLGFLHDRPMTGWDLSETVRLTIGNFWNVTISQIYRELRTLEEMGMVVAGELGVRSKRPYTITDEGREAFAEWITTEPGPLVARYPLLVTVWFGDHLTDEQMDWFLRLHRAEHQKRFKFLKQLKDEIDDETTPAARVVRFGYLFEESVMKWFESLPNFGGEEQRSEVPMEPRPSKPRSMDDPAPKGPPLRPARTPAKDRSRKGASKKRATKKRGPTRRRTR